jgi:hypothetical protein
VVVVVVAIVVGGGAVVVGEDVNGAVRSGGATALVAVAEPTNSATPATTPTTDAGTSS